MMEDKTPFELVKEDLKRGIDYWDRKLAGDSIRDDNMIRVIIESPLASKEAGQYQRNKEYAVSCMRDSISRDEAPFASHLLYTIRGLLNDLDPHDRTSGISMGFLWGQQADKIAVYTDLGISVGMNLGIDHYGNLGIPIEYRSLAEPLDAS
jgi:hypothetical protein